VIRFSVRPDLICLGGVPQARVNCVGFMMQVLEGGPDLSVPEQNVLVERLTTLAAEGLDDERIASLVQQLVVLMVRRADGSQTGQEAARRHNRIQSLIKRL